MLQPPELPCLTLLSVITGVQECGKSLCFMLGTKRCCPKLSWSCQRLLRPSQGDGSTAHLPDCVVAGRDMAVGCILFQRLLA